ncbi:MAG: ABC transporter substrate-binding protein [Dehalococcoidia bacterium]|nr:ABC transporter substrate-binding protein [Dehalococcoidia bacterium]
MKLRTRTGFNKTSLAIVAGLFAAMFVLAACGSDAVVEKIVPTSIPATATPQPTPTPDPSTALVNVDGIVDPTNLDWPRVVEGLNGRVTIPAQPLRIVTISLGHDEVTFALVPRDRVVAASVMTQSPDQSNVAHLAADLPEITSDTEVIVAQSPDIVIASPFTSLELIEALESVGMVVLQTDLHNDSDGRRQDIMLLGYAYGEEERAAVVVKEVEEFEAELRAVWESNPEGERVRVLSVTLYSDSLYTAGAGSTEGEIINIAGGINVADEAGLENNPVISYESLIAMDPEVIFIPQPAAWGGEKFRGAMLADPTLARVAAIRDGRVFMADPKYFTTLSFWNLKGAEALARDLWPEELADVTFGSFSFPSE